MNVTTDTCNDKTRGVYVDEIGVLPNCAEPLQPCLRLLQHTKVLTARLCACLRPHPNFWSLANVQEAETAQGQPSTRGPAVGVAGLRWVYDSGAPCASTPAGGNGPVVTQAGAPAALSVPHVYGERLGVQCTAPREQSPDGRSQGTAGDPGGVSQARAEPQRSKE
jgi:hypothetical protein